MITDKEEFFRMAERKIIEYEDRDTGISIRLREMNAQQAFSLLEALTNKMPRDQVCARALIFSAIGPEPDNKPLFQEEDFPKILEVKAADLLSAGSRALEMSGIYGTKKNGSAENGDSS